MEISPLLARIPPLFRNSQQQGGGGFWLEILVIVGIAAEISEFDKFGARVAVSSRILSTKLNENL